MRYQDELLAIIRKHVSNGKVYLFGSRARGTNTPESDIDIAIDGGKRLADGVLGLIREEIEESTIPFFVDVLDFHTLDNAMQQTILKEGVPWKI
jgi:predicted nucleotidyltransferase